MTKFTLANFLKLYGTNEKCLEAIKNIRYPTGITCKRCKEVTKHYKIEDRLQYACSTCGTHIAPLVGTIFQKSTTPLVSWFYVMFQMINTRSGVSAKQIQRELGVSYKTAWRMMKQIRGLMAHSEVVKLQGIVEVDETFVGGKGWNRRYVPHFGEKQKEIIMGMIERNGKAYLKHIPTTGKWALFEQIEKYIDKNAQIYTDQLGGYKSLKKIGYKHKAVNHNVEYTDGDVSVQSAEAMWSNLKRGIYGVYRNVSPKYLESYANEYAWRFNNRHEKGYMFSVLLNQIAA